MTLTTHVLHVSLVLELHLLVLVRMLIVKLAPLLNVCNVIKAFTGIQMQLHQYVRHVLILCVLLVQVILAHHAKQEIMIIVGLVQLVLLAAMIV